MSKKTSHPNLVNPSVEHTEVPPSIPDEWPPLSEVPPSGEFRGVSEGFRGVSPSSEVPPLGGFRGVSGGFRGVSTSFGSPPFGGIEGGIGIFGGSFNPVHNGHIGLARQLLELAGLDEVWFVVSPQNPLKPAAGLLDDHKRMEMVRMALEDEPRLVPCDYELHLPKPSYMWNTLQSMSRDYPDRSFTLLIGADNWLCFDRWFNSAEILNNYPIAIYPRTGSVVDAATLPPTVRLLDARLLDISSTEVRRRISQGLPVDGMVPPAVADFITREHLYL